jgi:hypothetical protein
MVGHHSATDQDHVEVRIHELTAIDAAPEFQPNAAEVAVRMVDSSTAAVHKATIPAVMTSDAD